MDKKAKFSLLCIVITIYCIVDFDRLHILPSILAIILLISLPFIGMLKGFESKTFSWTLGLSNIGCYIIIFYWIAFSII